MNLWLCVIFRTLSGNHKVVLLQICIKKILKSVFEAESLCSICFNASNATFLCSFDVYS